MSKKHKSSQKSAQAAGKRRADKRLKRKAKKPSRARALGGERAPIAELPSDDAQDSAPAIVDKTAELAERAWKYADSDELREALEGLSNEEAAMFVLLVEKQIKRRRIQLIGYALSLVVFFAGMFLALYLYANREPGEFVGWAFLIPFTAVAATMVIFGRLARKA